MATEFAWWSTSNSYGTYTYALSYDLLSQSTANNTSTIRVYGVLKLPVYISWSRGSASVHTSSFGLATYYGAGNHTIGSVDITVGHNSDGTGSVYVGGSISTSYLMNGSCGGTIYLPKINRYPTLNSGSNFTDRTNPVFNITAYGTYPLKVKLEAGGNTNLITRNLTSKNSQTYTLQLTDAERKLLRSKSTNGKTVVVRETVCAMSGSTELSWSYGDYIMNIVRKPVKVMRDGSWVNAFPYVRVNGEWKEVKPYIRDNNSWKEEK